MVVVELSKPYSVAELDQLIEKHGLGTMWEHESALMHPQSLRAALEAAAEEERLEAEEAAAEEAAAADQA